MLASPRAGPYLNYVTRNVSSILFFVFWCFLEGEGEAATSIRSAAHLASVTNKT